MIRLRNLIWWWKHQWPRYAIILEVPRPENFTVVLTLDTTLHYLRVIHKLLWQNEADRWYCKCQLYEDFLLKYRGPILRVTWSRKWIRCVKNVWIFAPVMAVNKPKLKVKTRRCCPLFHCWADCHMCFSRNFQIKKKDCLIMIKQK